MYSTYLTIKQKCAIKFTQLPAARTTNNVDTMFENKAYRKIKFDFNSVTEELNVYIESLIDGRFQHVGIILEARQMFKFGKVNINNRNMFTDKFDVLTQQIKSMNPENPYRKKIINYTTMLIRMVVIDNVRIYMNDYLKHYNKLLKEKSFKNNLEKFYKVLNKGNLEETVLETIQLRQQCVMLGKEYCTPNARDSIAVIVNKLETYGSAVVSNLRESLMMSINKLKDVHYQFLVSINAHTILDVCFNCNNAFVHKTNETCQNNVPHQMCTKCLYMNLKEKNCLLCLKLNNIIKYNDVLKKLQSSPSLLSLPSSSSLSSLSDQQKKKRKNCNKKNRDTVQNVVANDNVTRNLDDGNSDDDVPRKRKSSENVCERNDDSKFYKLKLDQYKRQNLVNRMTRKTPVVNTVQVRTDLLQRNNVINDYTDDENQDDNDSGVFNVNDREDVANETKVIGSVAQENNNDEEEEEMILKSELTQNVLQSSLDVFQSSQNSVQTFNENNDSQEQPDTSINDGDSKDGCDTDGRDITNVANDDDNVADHIKQEIPDDEIQLECEQIIIKIESDDLEDVTLKGPTTPSRDSDSDCQIVDDGNLFDASRFKPKTGYVFRKKINVVKKNSVDEINLEKTQNGYYKPKHVRRRRNFTPTVAMKKQMDDNDAASSYFNDNASTSSNSVTPIPFASPNTPFASPNTELSFDDELDLLQVNVLKEMSSKQVKNVISDNNMAVCVFTDEFVLEQ
ncbi:hoar [Lambdina fiscellaria nucleopolyhedrovirus]|uniref:Hoar n=1 Tax=Lambdina fiscellaria nucleopolyhedrovirus TaxID=1642929 RepID=A0A0E3URN8_9ABAC|nr:hoar [Lambdina fiscellaria nucleopolyhedrovirus]AKC91629.1 hoar [Lambdina fiscellaria nucleopolyhedrovirus]